MLAWLRNRPGTAVAVGTSAGLLLGAGMVAGVLLAVGLIGARSEYSIPGLSEAKVGATATHSGELFAMATGAVDEEVEGIYVLDYITGELSCTVVSPRTAKVVGLFKASILDDLDSKNAKKPRYLLVTGSIHPLQGEANGRPAQSLVYVLEESTGNFAAYSFRWNASLAKQSSPQSGFLTKIVSGKAAKKNI